MRYTYETLNYHEICALMLALARGQEIDALLAEYGTEAAEIDALRTVLGQVNAAIPGGIAFWVLGSIYGGIASVTESACVGVAAVIVAGLYRRELSLGIVYAAVPAIAVVPEIPTSPELRAFMAEIDRLRPARQG